MTTRRRDEQGAIALMTALLSVVLLACSALAVDIASLSSERQQLHDTVDTSALSGALLLPDGSAAEAEARAVAQNNDANASPAVNFYCIVGSKGTPPVVDPLFIPTACNPGPAAVRRRRLLSRPEVQRQDLRDPCVPTEGDACNAIEVGDEKPVPFGFAGVLGVNKGSTGSLSAVACKGGCGTLASTRSTSQSSPTGRARCRPPHSVRSRPASRTCSR